MLYDSAEGSAGIGPWNVETSEENGFHYLTLDGKVTEKGYPLRKTALKAARILNEKGGYDRPVIIDTRKGETPLETAKRQPVSPFGSDAPPSSIPNPRKRKAPKPAAVAPELTPEAKAGKATHSAVIFNGSREEWLNALVASHRPHFERVGFPLPEKIRVSVGFPLNSRKGKVIGVCYRVEASTDGVNEIFVTPTLDDSAKLAEVLTHELAHAATPGDKHGPTFGKCVRALGLEGKLTATTAGEAWHEWADPILAALGPIPHAALNPFEHAKKQTTRLLKGECQECGFVVRLTAKWVNQADGSLQCPDSACGGPLEVTGGDA